MKEENRIPIALSVKIRRNENNIVGMGLVSGMVVPLDKSHYIRIKVRPNGGNSLNVHRGVMISKTEKGWSHGFECFFPRINVW